MYIFATSIHGHLQKVWSFTVKSRGDKERQNFQINSQKLCRQQQKCCQRTVRGSRSCFSVNVWPLLACMLAVICRAPICGRRSWLSYLEKSTDTQFSSLTHRSFIRLMQSLIVRFIHVSRALQKLHYIKPVITFLFIVSTGSSVCSLCNLKKKKKKIDD